jgi:hypothetical protein
VVLFFIEQVFSLMEEPCAFSRLSGDPVVITAWLLAKWVEVDIVGLVRGNDAIFAENSGDELGDCVCNVRTTHLRGIYDRERGEASAGFA